MNDEIKALIEKEYRLKIKTTTPVPRQFVAETHILESESEVKYFCKLIKYNKYAERTIQSLPVLEHLYELGIKNINYPIKTISGDLYLLRDSTLIILFNYIDAVQSFDYKNEKLGVLLAEIHSKTPKLSVTLPKEDFSLLYKDDFGKAFEAALNPKPFDKFTMELQHILAQYEKEIRDDWKAFLNLIQQCQSEDFKFVITHGDAPGNVLVDSNKDIFLIDWDTILLAPAERDMWFLKEDASFMNSYKSIFPNYQINDLVYKFYLYNRYFEDMLGFIEEVLSDKSDDHKQKNLNDLKKDCFDKWLRPLIRALD